MRAVMPCATEQRPSRLAQSGPDEATSASAKPVKLAASYRFASQPELYRLDRTDNACAGIAGAHSIVS